MRARLKFENYRRKIKRGCINYYYCCCRRCCYRPPHDRPLTVFKRVADIGAGGAAGAADGDGDVTTATTIRRRRQRQTRTIRTIAVHRKLLLPRRPLRQPRPHDTVTPAGGVDVGARGGADDVGVRVGDSNRYTQPWYRIAKRPPFRTFSRRPRRRSRTTRWPRPRTRPTTVCRTPTRLQRPRPSAVAATVV